jgi:ubiquinone/menaquinone biosynthesis C-methylase UbiE
LRYLGQGISVAVARFPATWPLFRGFTRRFFDRIAPEWDSRISAPDRMAPLEAALDALDGEPARILDLGTGTGAGAVWLAERFPGARVSGVDLAPEMVERARRHAAQAGSGDRVSFEVADATSLPFAAGEFELITQVSVPAFFAETARVLAPGGHLVVVSSLGSATPAHTPPGLLRRGFERQGLDWLADGAAGRGTYYVMRRPT